MTEIYKVVNYHAEYILPTSCWKSLSKKWLKKRLSFLIKCIAKKDFSFACKHRRKREPKTKICIYIYTILTNIPFKSYIALTKWRWVIVKWSHCKGASFFIYISLRYSYLERIQTTDFVFFSFTFLLFSFILVLLNFENNEMLLLFYSFLPTDLIMPLSVFTFFSLCSFCFPLFSVSF